jgi:hypothetical protein
MTQTYLVSGRRSSGDGYAFPGRAFENAGFRHVRDVEEGLPYRLMRLDR